MEFYLAFLILFIGVWGMVSKENVIKKIIGLNITNSAVILFFILVGHHYGSTAPIMEKGVKDVVDPLPQALMITTIVIGICLTSLALALALKIYRKYNTLNISRIEKLAKDE
ncbi:MAG: cation:proton antiporter subunit C [Candidatus Aerophobetes bacterium]|nr:cation:proton antiporter subunit C [Candidatus Aerophobetes bacterium]